MPYALVMGASGDIGQAVCEKLAGQGWSLYCHYNQQKEKVLNFVSDLQKRYPLISSGWDCFCLRLYFLRVASRDESRSNGCVMASSFENTATFVTEFAGEIGKKWKWPCRIYRISLWTSWKQHGDRL